MKQRPPKEKLADRIILYSGDSLKILPTLPADSIDSVVCDPPYHLSTVKRFGKEGSAPAKHGKDGLYTRASRGFMGKQWDGGDIAFRVETWAEVYRVMKPGAYLVAFGGTRTFHRMVCAIEDAGFQVRDTLMWIYGSGFPGRSFNISKGIDKKLGAQRNKVKYANPRNPKSIRGGRDIEGGDRPWIKEARKVGYHELDDNDPITPETVKWDGWGTALKPAYEPILLARKPLEKGLTIAGNVLKYGTGALNIDGCRIGNGESRPSSTGGMGRKASPVYGQFANSEVDKTTTTKGRWPANVTHDGSAEVVALFPDGESQRTTVTSKSGIVYGGGAGLPSHTGNDSGSAARFFYTTKADQADRKGSKHPTVKPVDLIQWLVRLVTPTGGTVLDCFAGSGTTGAAAYREGFRCVMMEAEPEYQDDIRNRIKRLVDTPDFFIHRPVSKPKVQTPSFKDLWHVK